MTSEDQIILSIVREILGRPRSENETSWIQFNCPSPICRQDHDKFNLEYNPSERRYRCWKCHFESETNEKGDKVYRGGVQNLVYRYGDKEKLERLKLVMPSYKKDLSRVESKRKIVDYDAITCELPKEYLPLSIFRNTPTFKLAWDYVTKDRKLTLAQIDKYKIGYAEQGDFKNKLIIPSFNRLGKINAFIHRSFLKGKKGFYGKSKGINFQNIIFNEKFVNWDLPIILAEGFFDNIRLPNCSAILGCVVAIQFDWTHFLPEQHGQISFSVLEFIDSAHI